MKWSIFGGIDPQFVLLKTGKPASTSFSGDYYVKKNSGVRFFSVITLIFLCLAQMQAPVKASYSQKAEELTSYIQANFYDSAQKRYHPTYPREKGKLPWDVMWSNGIVLGMLADATRYDPAQYKPILYNFTLGLTNYYWDPTAPVPAYNAYCSGPGGTDKFYDDNEWMVLDFVNAYEATHDPAFLSFARCTQTFVLSGWDNVLGGGIYWKIDHQQKNSCSNAPAAASAFRISQATGDMEQMGWGLTIRKWTNRTLQDTDGLFWDHINIDGHIERRKWTYNAALMIWTNLLYYQLKNDQPSLREAKRLADASIEHWTDPDTGALQKGEGSFLFSHLLCEALLRLYDVTHDQKYLDAVRRTASFAYRHFRDSSGEYWGTMRSAQAHTGSKSLIELAPIARVYWLLAKYPDPDDIYKGALETIKKGDNTGAMVELKEVVESDPENASAHYYLSVIYKKLNRVADAQAEEVIIEKLAKNPNYLAELTPLGWKPDELGGK
jgi:rhamnogalacturonyl hydrolase YesR